MQIHVNKLDKITCEWFQSVKCDRRSGDTLSCTRGL